MNPLLNGQSGRLLEFQIVAVIGKRLDFHRLPVVADANNGDFGVLDHLDKSCDTTSITGTNTINLIHDDHRFLSVLASHGLDQRVAQVLLLLFLTSDSPVIETFVQAKCSNLTLDTGFISAV